MTLLVALLVLASPPGKAEVVECVQAFERAQSSVRLGQLVNAKEPLARCSKRSCPALVQTDCVKLLERVLSEVPTALIVVKEGEEDVVENVEVLVDGSAIPKSMLGRPLELDPGLRVITAIRADQRRAEQRLVFVVQEKARRVVLQFEAEPTKEPEKVEEGRIEVRTGPIASPPPETPVQVEWPVAPFAAARALLDFSHLPQVGLGLMVSAGAIARYWLAELSFVWGRHLGLEVRAGPRLSLLGNLLGLQLTADGALFFSSPVAGGGGASVGASVQPHSLVAVVLEGSLRYMMRPSSTPGLYAYTSLSIRVRWPAAVP